jgi:hypothetical protein
MPAHAFLAALAAEAAFAGAAQLQATVNSSYWHFTQPLKSLMASQVTTIVYNSVPNYLAVFFIVIICMYVCKKSLIVHSWNKNSITFLKGMTGGRQQHGRNYLLIMVNKQRRYTRISLRQCTLQPHGGHRKHCKHTTTAVTHCLSGLLTETRKLAKLLFMKFFYFYVEMILRCQVVF